MSEKELAKTEVPGYLKLPDEQDTGTEGITSECMVIPRFKICQALSEMKKEKPELDLKDGQIYTNTGDVYAAKLPFYVLAFWQSIVYFGKDKKMLCQSVFDPATKIYNHFGSDLDVIHLSEEDLAKKEIKKLDSHNYFVIPEKAIAQAMKKGAVPIPMMYSGVSAALKYTRQLNGKLKTNGTNRIPIYGQLVTMTTKEDTFPGGAAFMPRFAYERFATEDEAKLLKGMFDACKELMNRSDVMSDGGEDKTTEPKPVGDAPPTDIPGQEIMPDTEDAPATEQAPSDDTIFEEEEK